MTHCENLLDLLDLGNSYGMTDFDVDTTMSFNEVANTTDLIWYSTASVD